MKSSLNVLRTFRRPITGSILARCLVTGAPRLSGAKYGEKLPKSTKSRPPPQQNRAPAPSTPANSWIARWRTFNTDPKNRKMIAIGMILLYTVTGFGLVRYLKDTKYKATGDPSPYLSESSVDNGGIVPAHDTTPIYDTLAKEYDSKIWMEELTSYIWWMRRRLMKQVRGDALEISCGTGRNVKYLNPKQVSSLTLTDSSEPMLEEAKLKFEKSFPKYEAVQYVQGHAEQLSAMAAKSGQRFDTIYESFGLCSHEDPDRALQNMRSLLKPGGHIVLLEHGRGPYESMNKRIDEKAAERAKEWGCRWNLDIDGMVRRSGLRIDSEDRYHFGTIYFYVLSEPSAASANTLGNGVATAN